MAKKATEVANGNETNGNGNKTLYAAIAASILGIGGAGVGGVSIGGASTPSTPTREQVEKFQEELAYMKDSCRIILNGEVKSARKR